MPKNKHVSLERARKLIIDLEDHFNQITHFHRLIILASDCERADDMRLILDAYIPIGECRLEEIGQILVLLKQTIKQK